MLFAKIGHVMFSKRRVKELLVNSSNNQLIGNAKLHASLQSQYKNNQLLDKSMQMGVNKRFLLSNKSL